MSVDHSASPRKGSHREHVLVLRGIAVDASLDRACSVGGHALLLRPCVGWLCFGAWQHHQPLHLLQPLLPHGLLPCATFSQGLCMRWGCRLLRGAHLSFMTADWPYRAVASAHACGAVSTRWPPLAIAITALAMRTRQKHASSTEQLCMVFMPRYKE